jgi:large subunit ribosomal protein L23
MAIFENKETKKDVKRDAAVSAGALSVEMARFANKVLLRQRLTEKAYLMQTLNQYMFQVAPDVTKTDVRHAVEAAYGVHVEKVQTITMHPRKRNFGRTVGTTSGMKKAIVTIRKGEEITIFKTA